MMHLFFVDLFLILAFSLANGQVQYKYSSIAVQNGLVNVTSNVEKVTFFAIGDAGGIPIFPHNTINGIDSSKQLKSLSSTYNPNFNVLLGDNFYWKGVKDANDDRFENTFKKYFTTDQLKNVPWLITLGNHDYYGKAQAQVDYSKKASIWIMPDFNYTVNVMTKSQKQLMTIMMIDTIKMCGNVPESDTSKQPAYTSTDEQNRAAAYLADFEQKLSSISQTKVPYIVVIGHFPVWSVSSHGPTQCLVDKVRPLLHKYKVSAYISGHDHNLQHIQDTYLGQTVNYIVSGCGSYSDSSKQNANKVPAGSFKYMWSDPLKIFTGGFVLVEADTSSMKVKFLKSSSVLYQLSINPRS